MAQDDIRRSKRIISVAAGMAFLAVAGFWVTRGDARSERIASQEPVTLAEPSLVDNGMGRFGYPGLGPPLSLLERMTTHFKLSENQVIKAQGIMDEYGPRLRNLRERASEDESVLAEAERVRAERNKRLTVLLTPEQRKRLPTFLWRRPPGAIPGI